MDPYKSQAVELELVVSDVIMEVRCWSSMKKEQEKHEASISFKKGNETDTDPPLKFPRGIRF